MNKNLDELERSFGSWTNAFKLDEIFFLIEQSDPYNSRYQSLPAHTNPIYLEIMKEWKFK